MSERHHAPTFPKTFVADSARHGGIVAYSSTSGAVVKVLTSSDRDGIPAVDTGSKRWIYFTRPSDDPTACRYQLWRVPISGGPAHPIAMASPPGGSYAVNDRDHLLAYATIPDPCNLNAGDMLVVVENLRTGAKHIIEAETGEGSTTLAWSPDGTTLAIVTPTSAPGGAVTDRIHLINDPFRTTKIDTTDLAACPNHNTCNQQSPTYDADGTLFYLAQTGPRACWLAGCTTQTYELVRSDSRSATVLFSKPARAGLVVRGTVDPAGTAAIFTMPDPTGHHLDLWRWTATSLMRIPVVGAFNPTW